MSPSPSREEIHQMALRWMPSIGQASGMRILTDTSDFFNVDYGDILLLGGTPYLIRNNAKEGRFGLDDDVKYWVKRSLDLSSGELKIIKLVYYEKFQATIGGIQFECFRSPRKEARILELVRNHPSFMQGFSTSDEKGNTIRVLDYIPGKTLHDIVADIQETHETYFHGAFPGILDNFIECTEAIRFLHENGEKHGDIRRDHILVDRAANHYRWIDFDFNYRHRENIYGYDLFGLGNVLMYIVGKGDILLDDLKKKSPDTLTRLTEGDMNIVFHNRVANLKKIYPYVPEALNQVLRHFSKESSWFYEKTDQLITDLKDARRQLTESSA
ncbi:MAG: serine/threonine protein kinase [Desulfosarcina sp.]